MPDAKRPLKVFLCHSSHDKAVVRELYQRLKSEGWIEPWLDEENLYPGQDWDLEIEKAVETADAVIICLSNNSVSKEGYLQRELRFVLRIADYKPEGTVFVIPVRLDACHIPRRLEMWQYVDYFPESRKDWAYQRLLGSLKVRAQKLGISTVDPVAEEKARKEKRAQEKREAAEKSAREKAEREAAERIAREKAELDAIEKAGRDNAASSQSVQPAQEKPVETKPEVVPEKNKPEKPVSASPVAQKAPEKPPRKLKPEYIIAIIGAAATLLAALIGVLPQIIKPAPALTATNTPTITATFTSLPPSQAPAPDLTPTPLPTEIVDSKRVTMRLVPAGEFTMGSDDYSDDERPAHSVYLDDFYMDTYEVTNAFYASCVEAGVCSPPSTAGSYTRENYYGSPEFGNYPVIYVDWERAKTYCEWRGARLPTEAEWEKAARGGRAGNLYPWGDVFEDGQANFCDTNCSFDWKSKTINDGYADTSPVGVYPPNAYGLHDMAGNVWEWTADWYDAYPGNTVSNSSYGTFHRVLRGGSWGSYDDNLRVLNRYGDYPDVTDNVIGFRCLRSP